MILFLTFGVVSTLCLVYFYLTRKFNYWNKKHVPHLKPVPFFGNYADYLLCKSTWGETEDRICQQFPDAPLVGSYFGSEPTLIVKDPEFLKLVTTKDFYYFSGREISDYTHKEWVLSNLFNTSGDKWKVLRQNLTPLFSSAKMKNMFHFIENCSRTFETTLEREIKISRNQEIRSFFSRFTMDCIGTCGFGIDPKAMSTDQENPFVKIGQEIFKPQYAFFVKQFLRSTSPSLFYSLGLKSFPDAIANFFNKLLVGVFEERQYKQTKKNDFVDLILGFVDKKYIVGDSMSNMKNNNKEKVKIELDTNLLVAQCFVFFAAGFETSATTASYLLYELAKDQAAQERARREARDWLRARGGQLAYECVTELPFLEQCVDETLRLYPVLGVITREVADTYRFESGLTVERGLRVHLPVYHLHRNPKYFPEPDAFRPERFAPENKHNIHPYTYMPFGEGPRLCIGMRFAKMQVMAGLVTILKKYRVELAEGMPRTIDFEPKSLVTASKQGIQLFFTPFED